MSHKVDTEVKFASSCLDLSMQELANCDGNLGSNSSRTGCSKSYFGCRENNDVFSDEP